MFVWKAKTVLDNLERLLPETAEPFQGIRAAWDSPNQQYALQEWFPKLPKISIDYAVMEKTDRVYVIKLNCKWLDMGSFAALADFISSDKNNNLVVAAQSELLDCKDSIVITEDEGHLIAGIGLKNIIIAHSSDATLVCPLDQTAKLKELLELIEKHTGEKFL